MKSTKIIVLLSALPILALTVSLMSIKEVQKTASENNSQFTVITVKGQILFKSTGSSMKRGDTYLKGVPLSFLSKKSRAAIINKKDGRFVLSGSKRGKVSMLPAANPISSRGGALINIIDLKKHFDGDLFVIDRLKLKVNKMSFPQNDDTYFYVKYEHDGEVIPKKLGHDEDQLIIDKDELFLIDGKAIAVEQKEMTLYYKGSEKSYKISNFTPVFADKEVLKAEMDLLLGLGDYESSEEKYWAAASFAQDFYGKPDKTNLSEWLLKEYN